MREFVQTAVDIILLQGCTSCTRLKTWNKVFGYVSLVINPHPPTRDLICWCMLGNKSTFRRASKSPRGGYLPGGFPHARLICEPRIRMSSL